MARRAFAVLAMVALVGAGAVGVAGPASAAGVTVGSGSGLTFVCHATATVVPSTIDWGRGVWEESGTVGGDGSCQSGGATWQVNFSGTWSRFGGGRGSTCPVSDFHLWDMHLANPNASFDTAQEWRELSGESPTGPSRQVIAVNPIDMPPGGVPIGTDALFVPVPTSLGVAETDPAGCAAWPTAPSPEPVEYPAPPPFHATVDWNFPGPPLGAPSPPGGLLQTCLTVQGVVPRSCV
jgi:hypothetical protein